VRMRKMRVFTMAYALHIARKNKSIRSPSRRIAQEATGRPFGMVTAVFQASGIGELPWPSSSDLRPRKALLRSIRILSVTFVSFPPRRFPASDFRLSTQRYRA